MCTQVALAYGRMWVWLDCRANMRSSAKNAVIAKCTKAIQGPLPTYNVQMTTLDSLDTIDSLFGVWLMKANCLCGLHTHINDERVCTPYAC